MFGQDIGCHQPEKAWCRTGQHEESRVSRRARFQAFPSPIHATSSRWTHVYQPGCITENMIHGRSRKEQVHASVRSLTDKLRSLRPRACCNLLLSGGEEASRATWKLSISSRLCKVCNSTEMYGVEALFEGGPFKCFQKTPFSFAVCRRMESDFSR